MMQVNILISGKYLINTSKKTNKFIMLVTINELNII